MFISRADKLYSMIYPEQHMYYCFNNLVVIVLAVRAKSWWFFHNSTTPGHIWVKFGIHLMLFSWTLWHS